MRIGSRSENVATCSGSAETSSGEASAAIAASRGLRAAIRTGGRDELPPRSDGRARSIDRHADRVRLAVLVGERRFDAEQVVAGQLGLDPREGGVGVHGDVEERAARRAGQHLDALAPVRSGRQTAPWARRACAMSNS